MGAKGAPTSEEAMLTRWRRDYRLSIVLVGLGAVMLVAVALVSLWANWTGNYPTSFWSGLAMDLIETAGAMLVLLGGTVAYYHRSGLRASRRNA